jgi:hypothetical protein
MSFQDLLNDISIIQIGLGAASWMFVLLRTVRDIYARLLWRLAYNDVQGLVVGGLIDFSMSDRLGLGRVSF